MMSTTVLETCRGIQETYCKTTICALSWLIAKTPLSYFTVPGIIEKVGFIGTWFN